MKKQILCVITLSLMACQPAEEAAISVDASSDRLSDSVNENTVTETKGVENDVNAIADKYIENMFMFSPELGTFYQVAGADHVNISDISPAGIARKKEAEDTLYESLKAIDVKNLAKNDVITYHLLKSQLEGSIKQRVCEQNLWSMNHLDAFYIWYQYIGKNQPVGEEASRADTLARWAKIPTYIAQDMANNKKGLETGYALARPVVERVIGQLQQLLAAPIEENVFYLPALRDETPEFQQQMKAQIEGSIMPAIQAYLTFMQDEYLALARPNLSISTIPNGPACYTAMLNAATTLANGPADIYAWGEEAIAEREAMIRALGKQIYGTDDLAVIKETFNSDPNNFFKTKAELLADAQAAIDRAKVKSRAYFNLYPKADVILEPISELEEKTGYSRYLEASDDGRQPATYIQATYPPEKQVKGNIESTAFHETYPGHHLQVAISNELVKSHKVTKYIWNAGFGEGWARYTETLADEIGLYSSNNHRIAMYMGLPTGMVVDPGIHFKNWTRDEAVAYTLSKQTSMTQDDAERYVDRISVWPGQMTTYGVGERFFIKLRKQAKDQLGDAFDIKAFHDVCLQNGAVTLDFVSAEVADYIAN